MTSLRYMHDAPKTVLMDEDEVADILMEVRYGKRAPSSSKYRAFRDILALA